MRTKHVVVLPYDEKWKHADAVSEYSRIKIEAAKLYPGDIDKYIEYKSPVISLPWI